MMATFCLAVQSSGLDAPPTSSLDPNHLLKSSDDGSESWMPDCLTDNGPTSNGDLSGQIGSLVSAEKFKRECLAETHHRRLLLKLDIQPCSHLVVEHYIEQGIVLHPHPPGSMPPSL